MAATTKKYTKKELIALLNNITDIKVLSEELNGYPIEVINDYWNSTSLQNPKKPDEIIYAEKIRLYLIAFSPEGTLPKMYIGKSILRNSIEHSKAFEFLGQKNHDPKGTLTITSEIATIPLEHLQAIIEILQINTIRFAFNCFDTHFSTGKIDYLKSIKTILCNGNSLPYNSTKLTSLPDDIGSLDKLEKLECNIQEITTIPPSFIKLTSLKNISLRNNKISELPEDFGKLVNLTEIDLRYNLLAKMPKSISEIKDL
jgi:Leucine-rich repeat (LRR) protein